MVLATKTFVASGLAFLLSRAEQLRRVQLRDACGGHDASDLRGRGQGGARKQIAVRRYQGPTNAATGGVGALSLSQGTEPSGRAMRQSRVV
jgi:hypothetical protein